MSTFKNKNCLRTIEAQIVQKLKNNEARLKFIGSYKSKSVYRDSRHSNWKLLIISSTATESKRIACNLPFENQLLGYIHYCTEISICY